MSDSTPGVSCSTCDLVVAGEPGPLDLDNIAEIKAQLDAFWRLARVAELTDEQSDQLEQLEAAILRAPVQTRADLIPKLQVLRNNLAAGARGDGADIEAVDTVLTWAQTDEALAA